MDQAPRRCRIARTAVLFLALVASATLGCGATEAIPSTAKVNPSVSTFSVDPNGCPATEESREGKISHEAYLRAHPDLTHAITVRLRAPAWNPPACDGDGSEAAQCPARDAALIERQALNQKEVDCALQAFGPPEALSGITSYWYEPPRRLTSGMPTPIGTAFSTLALWSQIEGVARQPYVERLNPL